MLVTSDPGLQKYLQSVLSKLSGSESLPMADNLEWLLQGKVQRLVLVITSLESQKVLERWNFDIVTDMGAVKNPEFTFPPSSDF
jgi:mitotic spindle assembly checkpoint protein MAD2